jgi:transcriptional regulator with XRE-family HTH domain
MQSGPQQLKDWMHRRRFMQQEAAEYFGWDETYISQLVNGRRSPGLENAVKIERATGIPVEAWVTSAVDIPAEPVGANARNRKHDKA